MAESLGIWAARGAAARSTAAKRSADGDGVLVRRRNVIGGLLAIAYDRMGVVLDSQGLALTALGGFGCWRRVGCRELRLPHLWKPFCLWLWDGSDPTVFLLAWVWLLAKGEVPGVASPT